MDQFPPSAQQSTLTQNKFQLVSDNKRYKTEVDWKQYNIKCLRESSSNNRINKQHVRTEIPNPVTLADMSVLTAEVPPVDESDDPDFETPNKRKYNKRKSPTSRSPSVTRSSANSTSSKKRSTGGTKEVMKDNIVRKLQENVEFYYKMVRELKDELRVKNRQLEYYHSKMAIINEISYVGISSVNGRFPENAEINE